MNAPKLLYFVSEDWYFCSHRLPLAIAAREAGFEVVVVTRVREHADQLHSAGLRVIPLELSRRGMNPLGEFRTLARLVMIYRRERPDVVHHVAMKPVLYGTLAAKLAGVRSVVNAIAGMGWLFTSRNPMARFIKPLAKIGFRVLLRRTQIIVQNPDDAAIMRSQGGKYVHLIRGSGVDVELFHPVASSADVPVVVLPARMLWDKGVGEFIDAAKKLKAGGAAARFVLVGKPDPENPATVVEAKLLDWQREGVAEWWGMRSDMPEVYRQASVVCLPSYREGLPKVLLEAAACGLPIVATDVPGCREIVQDGDNGYLVPPRQSGALADALARLISNPDLRAQMGAQGRKRAVESFAVEHVIRATLRLYKDILAPAMSNHMRSG